jgi:hypothetical protein
MTHVALSAVSADDVRSSNELVGKAALVTGGALGGAAAVAPCLCWLLTSFKRTVDSARSSITVDDRAGRPHARASKRLILLAAFAWDIWRNGVNKHVAAVGDNGVEVLGS